MANKPIETPIIFLMGPTATGKTGLAVEWVQRLPLSIISVDSALIYRGMDIGTAKPDAATLQRAPHRLIDILDPAECYSAAQFCTDARREIAHIIATGRIPLLVGGTMLYFRALQQGLAVLPPANATVRARLADEQNRYGLAALHARLAAVDPIAAARIHPHDPQRIQRALEVYEITGHTLTELCHAQSHPIPFTRCVKIALTLDRTALHHRIAQRFDTMLKQGLVEEVAALRARGDLTPMHPSMRAVGYRQVWQHLDGAYDANTLRERGIYATRQFAKRQMTWLRAESHLHSFHAQEKHLLDQTLQLIQSVINPAQYGC